MAKYAYPAIFTEEETGYSITFLKSAIGRLHFDKGFIQE